MFSGFDLTFTATHLNVLVVDVLLPLIGSLLYSLHFHILLTFFSAQCAPSSPLTITSMAPTPSTVDPPKCTHTTKV